MYICFIVLLKWELAEVAMVAVVPEVLQGDDLEGKETDVYENFQKDSCQKLSGGHSQNASL